MKCLSQKDFGHDDYNIQRRAKRLVCDWMNLFEADKAARAVVHDDSDNEYDDQGPEVIADEEGEDDVNISNRRRFLNSITKTTQQNKEKVQGKRQRDDMERQGLNNFSKKLMQAKWNNAFYPCWASIRHLLGVIRRDIGDV